MGALVSMSPGTLTDRELTLHPFENQLRNLAQKPHVCMLWPQFQLIQDGCYACLRCLPRGDHGTLISARL
jgi:hypothetical protein